MVIFKVFLRFNDKADQHISNSHKPRIRNKIPFISSMLTIVMMPGCSLSSCHETSRRFLRYGNSFPSTFPEVLLAHASPNDWPIVAKHANMTSSRQYKCDARDNYIRIFYFTLNLWWLQYVRSARDQSNRWIITFTASPAWAWPTPRRRWTSPTADIAPGPPRYGSRPIRGGAHCRQRAAGGPPLSWRRECRLAMPPNPTVA